MSLFPKKVEYPLKICHIIVHKYMNWDAPTVFKQLPKAGMHFVTFAQILARC